MVWLTITDELENTMYGLSKFKLIHFLRGAIEELASIYHGEYNREEDETMRDWIQAMSVKVK